MATSGTIGTTSITTAQLLEHAMRRCGVSPAAQTPEVVQVAIDNLFLLLLMLSSRGINLWTVDKVIIPLVAGQATYVLPPGTLDVLNASYATPSYATGTNTAAALSYTTQLASATSVPRISLAFSALPTNPVVLSGSNDNITYTVIQTIPVAQLTTSVSFYDTANLTAYSYFRVSTSAGAFTVATFGIMSQVSELKISQMNRDDYSAMPNKYQLGRPSVNYYFEKLVDPQMTLWNVPNTTGDQLVIWRYRQPQDIGNLQNTLEIPTRWFEAVVWQLAGRLAFELPNVDPQRKADVLTAMDKFLITTEGGETDGSPIYMSPNISVYSA